MNDHFIVERNHFSYGPTIYGRCGTIMGINTKPLESVWKEILAFYKASRIIFFDSAGDLNFGNDQGVFDAASMNEEKEFLRHWLG